MAVRFISKGKGRKRKSFPIRPKKGVTVRSVSLRPNAVVKVNKEQIRLINKGQPATFSKALNEVITRAKRDGIPIYDTHVNSNDRRKPYHMWIVKHPEKGDKVKGSDTIVMAEHYGQAIDDMITIWNKEERKNMTIGYPQVQGTADKSFRYARDRYNKDEDKTLKEMFEERGLNRPFFEEQQIIQAQKNPKNIGRRGHEQLVRKFWNDKVHPMGSSSGTLIARKDLDPDGYKKAMRDL